MNANLFLTTFLACTFSFVIVAVAFWQISTWLVTKLMKKAMEQSPALKSIFGTSTPEESEQLLMRMMSPTDPMMQNIIHDARMKNGPPRCRCGKEYPAIPDGVIVIDSVLIDNGWRFNHQLSMEFPTETWGWQCPECVAKQGAAA